MLHGPETLVIQRQQDQCLLVVPARHKREVADLNCLTMILRALDQQLVGPFFGDLIGFTEACREYRAEMTVVVEVTSRMVIVPRPAEVSDLPQAIAFKAVVHRHRDAGQVGMTHHPPITPEHQLSRPVYRHALDRSAPLRRVNVVAGLQGYGDQQARKHQTNSRPSSHDRNRALIGSP